MSAEWHGYILLDVYSKTYMSSCKGGLFSQRTKTKAWVDKIVPMLQKNRNFVNLSNTMHIFLWNFFLGKIFCSRCDSVMSHRWSREAKLWRPVTQEILSWIEIWLHIRVALSKIFLQISLKFILEKISKLTILVLFVPRKSVKAWVCDAYRI